MADYSLGTARGQIEIGFDDKGTGQAEAALGKVDKAGAQASAGVAKAGTVMGVAGLAIAGGFALAVKSAADFESRMSAVKAVSGASAGEMDKLTAKALQLGKDTSFSASEAAQAIEELVKAGVSVPDVMNGAADATVALAAAGEVALPQAAELSANAMNAFGLSAKEMPRIADLIAGAANASAIDVSQFGQSLSQVGAVANLAGVSFDDTATAIALLGNAGIKGSDAGTSLKTMFQRLIPTTVKQRDLMEELGLITEDGSNKFYDAAGNMKSLSDVSGLLQGALKGMTKEQQQATLTTLFGSDAVRGAAILAQEGAAGFDKMAASMGKVKAADVAKTRMDNLKGSLEVMKGSLETAGIAIGTILLPALRKIVDTVTAVINKFLELTPAQQQMVLTIIAAVGGFLLFAAAALKVGAAIKGLSGFISGAGSAMKALNLIFAANPIGLIIIAIGLLIVGIILLWKHSETFRNVVMTVWAAIKTAISAVVNWIMGTAVPFLVAAWAAIQAGLQAAWAFIVAAWNGIKTAVSTAITFIKGLLAAIWAPVSAGIAIVQAAFAVFWAWVMVQVNTFVAFWNSMWAMLSGPVTAAWAVITAIFTAAWAVLVAIVTTIVNGIITAWNLFGPAVMAIVNLAWTLIKATFQNAFAVISAIISVAWAVISSIFSGAFTIIVGIIKGGWEIIKGVFQAAWTIISGVVQGAINVVLGIIKLFVALLTGNWKAAWEAVKQILKGALGIVTSIIQGAFQLIVGVIKGAIAIIKSVITAAWNAIKTISSAVWNAIKSVITTVWNGIKSTITAAINAAKAIITSTLNAIKSVFTSVWNAVKSGVSSAWNGIKSAISSGISSAMSLVRGFKDKVVGFFSGAASWLVSAGRNIIAGLASGVRAAGQKVVDAALAVVNKVKSLLPGSPVKDGPLKVLNHGYAGGEIVRMIAAGIKRETPKLEGLALAMSASVARPIAAGGGALNLARYKGNAPAGNVYHIDNVSIPAADLAEMRGVADFFGRVQQEARRMNPRLRTGV